MFFWRERLKVPNFALVMPVSETYQIDLLERDIVGKVREWDVDDTFFASIDGLIRRGNVHVKAECTAASSVYKFLIQCEGTIVVPCDRCLADLELRVQTSDELQVTLGEDYSDDGDCVVVPETEGRVDLAQFIYEFIALSMPIACHHETGDCDDTMMQTLSVHQASRSIEDAENGDDSTSDDSDGPVDNRWDALADLKNKLNKN